MDVRRVDDEANHRIAVRCLAFQPPQAPGTRFGGDRVLPVIHTLPTSTTTFDDRFIPTTKGQDSILATPDVFIQALNCGIPPTQIASGFASILPTMLCEAEPLAHVYLEHDDQRSGLRRACDGVCQTLCRRLKARRLNGLTQAVLDAIGDLTA